MASNAPQSTMPQSRSLEQPMVEVVPLAPTHVGAVVRFRKVFASDVGFVFGRLQDGRLEIVKDNGEIAAVPVAKVKETLAEPSEDVRSTIGNLMRYLEGDVRYVRYPRSEPQAQIVRARINVLMGMREEAVALLLDRKPLALGLADCFALPIEPWRVRYEFLAARSSEGPDGMVGDLLADPATPPAVRAIVALKFSRSLSEAGPGVASLFGGYPHEGGLPPLVANAVRIAEELTALGVPAAGNLKVAATTPADLTGSNRNALLIAALDRTYPIGPMVEVDETTPLSVLDDLLDDRVRVSVVTDESGNPVDSSLQAYILARTDPEQLSSADIVSLGFEDEARRRYLSGDITVEPSLPPGAVDDIRAYRAAVAGSDSTSPISDLVLREVRDVLLSQGAIPPSEALLADKSVWRELIRAGVPGSPRTGPLGETFTGISALSRASTSLYEWRWDEARAIAREGLRDVRAEEVRDELLNIVACALWLSGEPELALAALDNALEGQYTDALLINASVVATELEHDSAKDRFVKLAKEAPNVHQRAVAAERALVLWDNDEERIWEEEHDGSLPNEIRDALRPLIKEDLPEDRYLRVLKVLANRDDDWFAAQSDDAFGSNIGTPAVRIFRARAAGLDKNIEALAVELKAGSTPEWVSHERDGMVEAAIQVLIERNDELATAFFGLTLIDANLPMSAEQRVPLKCLACIAANIDSKESEPNLRFIDLVVEAKRELSDVDYSDRDRLSGLVEFAAGRLAQSYLVSRYRQFDEVIDAYNMIMGQISGIPSHQLNPYALREAFHPLSAFCTDTYDIFKKLRPLIEDAQLEEAVDSMMRQSSDIGHRITAVTL